jgi:SAM-dependent methyltransferase
MAWLTSKGAVLSTVRDVESDLALYYDQDAARRAERPIDSSRVASRDAFIARLRAGRASTIIEVGIGPGRDAEAFLAAGVSCFGVDLSEVNVRIARMNGVAAAVASVRALPFADAAFDAGWTMSTLVHVPNVYFDAAMKEICRVIRPGGPLALGLWCGGTDVEGVKDDDEIMPKRFFSQRTDERLQGMLEPHGRIEVFDTWRRDHDSNWNYQFVVLRTHTSLVDRSATQATR